MIKQRLGAIEMVLPLLSLCGILLAVAFGAIPGLAQAPAPAPTPAPVPQNQPAPLPPPSTTTNVVSGVSRTGTAAAPVSTPATGVGNETSSSLGKSFGSVGNGLPGMPGGSPVNAIPGVKDPSPQYMSPPVIPPVLCDPAVDIPC